MRSDVSVVIVTGNRPPNVFMRAVRGVASQTVPPSKVVVVDTSTDDTLSESKRDATKTALDESDIVYIREPVSPGAARNIGASLCNTGWLCFLDDDDEWHPSKLEQQLERAEDDIAMISSPYGIDGGEQFPPGECGPPTRRTILSENIIGATSFPMISSAIFRDVGGFDPSFPANMEWDLWIRMSEKGGIAYTMETVGMKYTSEDCISVVPRRRSIGWIRLLMKHLDDYIRNPMEFSGALWRFWTEMIRMGRPLTALPVFCVYIPVRGWCILRNRR